MDIGFVGYSATTLLTGPAKDRGTNALALGADVLGAFIPCATGLRMIVRGGRAVDNVGDVLGGWKAASRPQGVPGDWVAKPSKTGGGTRFGDPSNPHNSVRVMPGNPSSPFPNSQGPSVRVTRNGQATDNAGNVVPKNSPDAHIPLGDFTFPK